VRPEDREALRLAMGGIRKSTGLARAGQPSSGVTITITPSGPEVDEGAEQMMGDEHAPEDMGIPAGIQPTDMDDDIMSRRRY
jgi:hypothetical protein